jgi:hypothetical protein
VFEGADGGVTLHCRKVVQELIESLPTFEVVQQRLKGNAGPAEDRCGPKAMVASRKSQARGQISRVFVARWQAWDFLMPRLQQRPACATALYD